MGLSLSAPKLRPWHLQRKAIVYIRQSTPQQVLDHRESADRQYGLVDRAVALGWPRDCVEVVDEDQGRSGQTAEGRPGCKLDDPAHPSSFESDGLPGQARQ